MTHDYDPLIANSRNIKPNSKQTRRKPVLQVITMDGKSSSNSAGKPIRCKAAIARKPGEPLVIEEVIVAPPKTGEVRIKIICTSLCHSDLTFWKLKDPPAIFPVILGHEALGVVESVGEGVHEVVEGDTVIPIFLPDCGECTDCLSEKSNLCTKFPFSVSHWMDREETSRFTDINGETLYHFLSVSSFSEYTVVDIVHLTKIDPTIPPNRACLLSCGISTGVGAAWKTAKVEAGTTVAIFGLGAIGLALTSNDKFEPETPSEQPLYPNYDSGKVAEGSRLCGAKRIIGVDVNQDKCEIGKKFGVTDFVNPGNCEDKTVSQVIMEMTGGGADYCFECVGMSSLVQEAYASCRKGWGKVVVLGVDHPNAMLTFNSFEVLYSGKSIMGSFFGGLKPKSDIRILEKRYKDEGFQGDNALREIEIQGVAPGYLKLLELRLDEFVTHEVEFKDINKAFELMIEGKSLRCVIWMNK